MDNRQLIMNSALTLFYESGYDAVGVQQIVDSAGVSKPTLYYYFGSKQGLLEALLNEHFQPMEQKLIEARFAVERRNRTIHKRMREYLFELTHNEGLLTSVVPLGDGIAITMKSHEKREETT